MKIGDARQELKSIYADIMVCDIGGMHPWEPIQA